MININRSDLRNFGVLLQADGKKYVGIWESEKLKGLGYSVDLNESKYKGDWDNKEYDGFGIYEEKNKSKHIKKAIATATTTELIINYALKAFGKRIRKYWELFS